MLQYSISIYLLYGCPNCAASIVLANFVVACWCSLHFSKGGGASFQRASFLGAVYGPQWAPTCSRESLLVPGSRLSMRAAKHINTIQYMSLLEESPESDMKNGASELRSKSGKGWLAPSKSTKHASSAASATASAVGWQLKIRGGCYACCNIIKMTFQKKMLIWFKQGQKKKSIWATLSAESMARPIVWVHLSKLHRKNTTHHLQLTQLQRVPKPGVLFVQARCQSTTRGSSDQEVQLGTTGKQPIPKKWKSTMQLQGTGCLPTKSIAADSTHLGFRSCSPQLPTSNPL